jgi:IMP cyclohydrolase
VMSRWSYEPDAPNFTPRITAESLWHKDTARISISILRKSLWGDGCDRNLYEYGGIGKGYGYCVTTYSGDGDPLPSFRGEPYLVRIVGGISEVLQRYWHILDGDNIVSLVVKFIPKEGPSVIRIINKYSKVA